MENGVVDDSIVRKVEDFDNGIIGKTVDFIFNNKLLVLLVLLFLLGFSLRFIAAVNVEPNADEMVHGSQAPGVISSGVIGRVWQSITWSYLTDMSTTIFGITLLSTRLLSLVLGSLTIFLVYLLGLELFDKKSAIIASFLMAIASFHVLYTVIEMDVPAIFFILLSSLVFIRRLKLDGKLSLLSAVFIGVAALIKTLSLFFVLPFLIGFWVYNKKVFSRSSMIQIFKFGVIIFLLFSPVFIHNYLWFKDSGMVDAYFSQYFNVGKSREAFAGIQGINQGFKVGELLSGSFIAISFLWDYDPVNLVLGLSALLFFVYRKNKHSLFFLLFQIIPFFLLVYTNRLPTHFSIFAPVFALYAGALISRSDDYVKKTYANISKYFLPVFIVLLLIIGSFYLVPYLGSRSAVGEIRSFVNNNTDENTVIVVDARTYRGRIMWGFMGTHYLESSFFPDVLNINQNATLSGVPANNYKLFFVECAVDDCGWGTIADQPDFNSSTESLISQVIPQLQLIKTINGGGSPYVDSDVPYFRVYGGAISLTPQAIQVIDSTHSFFFYPAFYNPKDQIIDYYDVNGFFDNLLLLLAKIIIWASIILSFVGMFLVIRWSLKSFRIVV